MSSRETLPDGCPPDAAEELALREARVRNNLVLELAMPPASWTGSSRQAWRFLPENWSLPGVSDGGSGSSIRWSGSKSGGLWRRDCRLQNRKDKHDTQRSSQRRADIASAVTRPHLNRGSAVRCDAPLPAAGGLCHTRAASGGPYRAWLEVRPGAGGLASAPGCAGTRRRTARGHQPARRLLAQLLETADGTRDRTANGIILAR